MCVMWAGPDLEHKAIDNDINLQNEYFANIVLDGTCTFRPDFLPFWLL